MSTLIQRSLASGEISPSLYQRVDLQKYQSGLRTLRNCVVKKGGGATNRAGTQYVYGAYDYDDDPSANFGLPPIGATTILVPFAAADSNDSYVLEFGNGFLRFTKNGALVTVDTALDWDIATAYTKGQIACYQGTNYYCILANTGNQPPNATYWYAMYGYEYSIPTPYTVTLLGDRGSFSFAQDTGRLLISHSSLLPYELVRTSDTLWTLTAWDVDGSSPTRYGIPRIGAPTGFNAAGGSASAVEDSYYAITAITTDLEEGLPLFGTDTDVASAAAPITVSWLVPSFIGAATGTIKGYNIYKKYQGIYFYIGFSDTAAVFIDYGINPEADSDSPPETREELATTTGTFPKKIGVFEGRTLLGNFSFNVQAIYASRVGQRQNFTRRFPSADDDSILFQIKGKQINGIKHFVDIGDLIVFTDSGEWIVTGNSNGTLVPSPPPVPKQYSANGSSSEVWPVTIGSRAAYVQAQGSVVRAIGFDSLAGGKNGFVDDDLTIFSEHLFKNKTIVSMSYQKTPHSILWCVLDDGVLLGCTYIKEQDILAWHTHDTDGLVEDVCCIPEGNEYGVYIIVKRVVQDDVGTATTVRYMERLATRDYEDIVDAVFLDCSLTFDGRNTTATHTMTLSGGTDWDEDETLTLTSSAIFFSDLEVDNEIWITGTDLLVYRFRVTACTSDYVVSVRPVNTIPSTSGIRSTATSSWSRAVDTVSGLEHLEGEEVGVFADGYVLANPNNADYGTALTVTDGAITIPACHAVITVGLPYISDIETLNIDTVNGETLVDKKKCISGVTMRVEDTRGVWAGPKPPSDDDTDPLENLMPLKIREAEDYSNPTNETTDEIEINITSEWNNNGRVFIRQIDPLPMTVLSIAPAGLVPFSGGR